jgi:hypothetical protein
VFARSCLLCAAVILFVGQEKLAAADPVGLQVVVGKDIHGKILTEKETKMCALQTPFAEYLADACVGGSLERAFTN